MSTLPSMDVPTIDVDLGPEKLEDEKQGGPLLHCDLCDMEVVHKLAQMFLPGLGSACVDNTSGDLFKTPGSMAVDLRKEMIEYVTQRSESFVAEAVILEGGPDGEVSDHPFDVISNFVDDFVSSKRNLFSRVSGWLLSEKREDKIDDFVQEMEINGFWSLDRREAIAETLLKNVDFENSYHCSMSFNSAEELANHVDNCKFRSMICENEGCNSRFCAAHLENHDSTCPFKIIQCEQKCSASIMRREMDRHCITGCPMKLVNCPFHAVGCRSAVSQCMIEKHRLDDVRSHLWHLLKGIYKQAYGDDLNRRVDQIVQASSISRLAEARDVRSLNFIVKDIEAKLGPFKGSVVEKNNAETLAKNGDGVVEKNNAETVAKNGEGGVVEKNNAETVAKNGEGVMEKNNAEIVTKNGEGVIGETDMNDSEKTKKASDMINSPDKAKVSDTMNMNNAENIAKNEDSQPGPVEKIPKNEDSPPSPVEKIDKNEDRQPSPVEKIPKNEDRQPSPVEKIPKNEDSQPSPVEKVAKNEDSQPSPIEKVAKNEDSQPSPVEKIAKTEDSQPSPVENIAKNEDSQPSPVENKGCEKRMQTSNTTNLSDKSEIGLMNDENKDAATSELKIKDKNESTQTHNEKSSNEEVSTTNEGNAENSIKSKYNEDHKFEDKDNEQSIQNS